MPVSTTVLGAGALGSVIAVRLQEAGSDPLLCTRRPQSGVELREDERVRTVPVRCTDDPGTVAPADVLLVTTKAHQVRGAADWLHALVGPRTLVVPVQNGVAHQQRFDGLVPADQVLPCVAYISAERMPDGVVDFFTGNRMQVPAGPDADRLAAAVAGSVLQVEPVDDFTTVAWRKLLGNVGANPVTALTGRRIEVATDPTVRGLVAGLLREAVAVGVAEGARLDETDVAEAMDWYGRLPPTTGTSMLYDRQATRPMEHEFLTGAVVDAGSRHGIPTPLNDTMLALLRALPGASG